MRSKIVNIFWGFILIAIGGLLLAERMDLIDFRLFSDQGWMLAFGVASAVFFFSYFLNGVKHWGWLFPALICAALALTIGMADADVDGSIMGVPILAAIAIPFYVGYLVDRKNWGVLIPAWIMTILAIITLIAEEAEGNWIGSLFLFAAALPFLVVFLMNRSRWWALIPAWTLFVLGLIALLSEHVDGNLIGALFLYSVALPFLVVYLTDRSRRWALIPAAVIAVVGTFPLIDLLFDGDLVGMVVMLFFAAPFFFVYFRWKEAWWALIPAGIFTSIALVVVLSLVFHENDDLLNRIGSGVLFLGFAATFGILWLRRATQPTDWAKYPAAGLLAAAVLAFALGERFQDYWPATLLLVGGVLLLLNTLVKKKPSEKGSIPTDNP